jgi:hypothetical protein
MVILCALAFKQGKLCEMSGILNVFGMGSARKLMLIGRSVFKAVWVTVLEGFLENSLSYLTYTCSKF